MTRPALAIGVLLLAATARAADFKLEAQPFDVVKVAGVQKPYRGLIEKQDDNLMVFKALTIRYRWPRSQVTILKRRCTLREAYERADKAAGEDPRAHLRLYEACVEAKLDKEAAAQLKRAIGLDPKYLPAYRQLLAVARDRRDIDMELGALQAATRAGVVTVPMLLRKAEVYVALGMIDNARDPLEHALRLDFSNAEATCRLVMVELVNGRLDRAEEHVRAMRRRDEKHPLAQLALAQLEVARGNLDKAAQAFTRVRARSKSATAAAALGALALRQGAMRRAREHYADAQLLHPGRATVLAGQGLLAAYDRQPDKAARLLDSAAAAAPKRPDVLAARGYVAELAGDRALALKTYQKALSLDGTHVDALIGAARCHWTLGDAKKGRSLASKALSLRPNSAAALRAMGRMTADSNPSEAERHLRALAGSRAATPDDHTARAGALLRLGRPREAAAEFARAGSDNVHGRIGLGFLAYEQGRDDEAVAHLEAAVRLGDYRQYAAKAIRRIHEAQRRLTWSDGFERDPPKDAKVRNDWEEIEPRGIAISISDNALLIDGRPATDDRLARLSRAHDASFVSITAEASTGSEAASFVGVFVAKPGGAPVLFGRHGSGRAALLRPGQAKPREFAQTIPQGRLTVGIEVVDKVRGAIRPLIDGRRVAGAGTVVIPELAGAASYTVGLFALPPKGRNVQCRFHAVKIVRSK